MSIKMCEENGQNNKWKDIEALQKIICKVRRNKKKKHIFIKKINVRRINKIKMKDKKKRSFHLGICICMCDCVFVFFFMSFGPISFWHLAHAVYLSRSLSASSMRINKYFGWKALKLIN